MTISQLGQAVVRGVSEAGPHRLEVAGDHGIPQVVTLGGLDIIVCHEGDPLLVQARAGARKSHQHSPVMTVLRPTPGESARIGAEIARRLNTARGPVSVLIPARGLSEYSTAGGPLFDPGADQALFSALRDHLSPRIPLREIDTGINDPQFAAELVRALAESAPELGPWTKLEELSS